MTDQPPLEFRYRTPDAWPSIGATYAEVRGRLDDLAGTPEVRALTAVPCCPEWRLADLLRHVTDIAEEGRERLTGSRGTSPTAEPGAAAANEVDALLVRWHDAARVVEPLMDDADRWANTVTMDAFTHELDLRSAIGAPLDVEHPAWCEAVNVLVQGFHENVCAERFPPLTISTPDGSAIVGDGPPRGEVGGTTVDICRSLSGRRSPAQIANLTWSGDPDVWLPAFRWGPFQPPPTPVEPMAKDSRGVRW